MPKKHSTNRIPQTLFNPDYKSHKGVFRHLPYYLALRAADDRPQDFGLPDDEAAIFSHIIEHEVQLYEQRGWIIGPITWKVGRSRAVDLGASAVPSAIPAFVESDALMFTKCSAAGVLLIESQLIFDRFVEQRTWSELNMIVTTGCGMPRFSTRRLLHRLSAEVSLPVYVLVDNDTWGYFLFSLLKRGALAPHARSEFLGVSDLRFVGVRAGDFATLGLSTPLRTWEPAWSVRLRHLRRYPCFATIAWRRELDRFARQGGAADLKVVYESLGHSRFLSEYLRVRIDRKKWLR